jgi:hypothetical protein
MPESVFNQSCGASPENSPTSRTCGTAKFEKCSQCGVVVVENGSGEPIKIEVQIIGSAFSDADVGQMVIGCRGGMAKGGCALLAPGGRCFESIQFCPDQAALSQGRVGVSLHSSEGSRKMTFPLHGTANYSPELEVADAVRKRHLDELMKIPNVVKVELKRSKKEIVIEVLVAQDLESAEWDEVHRALPRELDGYKVEVGTFVPVENAL